MAENMHDIMQDYASAILDVQIKGAAVVQVLEQDGKAAKDRIAKQRGGPTDMDNSMMPKKRKRLQLVNKAHADIVALRASINTALHDLAAHDHLDIEIPGTGTDG